MTTIYDVAKKAGVSIAAVSLVMNNPETPRVGATKRKQIMKIAAGLGYSPNGLAKALSYGSTRILGLVVPMRDPIFINHFIVEVLAGVQSSVIEHGYHLMIYSHAAASGRITQGELTQSRYVDGVIVLNTRMCSQQDMQDTIGDLKTASIPFVMTNCYAGEEKINYVGVDDYEIGRSAATYLLGQGKERIALISGAEKSPMTAQLLNGFKSALKESKRRFNPKLHFSSEYDPETIHRGIAAWFSQPGSPTAIFCADDQLVPDVYKALQLQRKRIPQDVVVLGRGNLAIATALNPLLTTISIPAFEMGKKAATLLIEVVQSKTRSVRRIILDSSLVKRDSA